MFTFLCQSAGAYAGEIAGRILVAAGDVFAVRAAKEIRLAAGSSVESGDRIVTGADSNAQIRFSDESIVALRPRTEFNIDDYHFAGKADGAEKGFFSLLKGGFRTLTGAIGKTNRDTYKVNAQTATIGIRGTHYNALLCQQQSCAGDDGQPSQDGLYGSVSDGRIALDNQAGSREFGKDEYFYVPDANTLPIRLIAPPSFLRDKLEGQIKSKASPAKASTQTAQGGAVKADNRSDSSAVSPAIGPTFVATENLGEKGSSSVLSPQNKAVTIVATGLNTSRNNEPDGGIIGPYGTSFRMVLGPNNTLLGYTSTYPSGNTFTATLGTASLVDAGSAPQAGNLNWGRWSGPGSVAEINFGFPIKMNGPNLHYIYGDPATDLPGSGIVSYKPIAWTTPTDSHGNAGQMVSGGIVSVNFSTAVASLGGLTVGINNALYTLGGSASFSPTHGQFFNASTQPAPNPGGATLSCSGTDCRLNQADFIGVIVGRGGAGIGLSYGIHNINTPLGSNNNSLTGVVGYSR